MIEYDSSEKRNYHYVVLEIDDSRTVLSRDELQGNPVGGKRARAPLLLSRVPPHGAVRVDHAEHRLAGCRSLSGWRAVCWCCLREQRSVSSRSKLSAEFCAWQFRMGAIRLAGWTGCERPRSEWVDDFLGQPRSLRSRRCVMFSMISVFHLSFGRTAPGVVRTNFRLLRLRRLRTRRCCFAAEFRPIVFHNHYVYVIASRC